MGDENCSYYEEINTLALKGGFCGLKKPQDILDGTKINFYKCNSDNHENCAVLLENKDDSSLVNRFYR